MKVMAHTYVWWLKLDQHLKDIVKACTSCQAIKDPLCLLLFIHCAVICCVPLKQLVPFCCVRMYRNLIIWYCIVKTLAVKSLVNKDCRKFGGKNFGKLKYICIGDVMDRVKIGKNLENCCNSPNSPKLLQSIFLLYGT